MVLCLQIHGMDKVSRHVFKCFKTKVKLLLGKKIKAIKFDYGEQRLRPFALFLKGCGIILQYIMSSKPNMNESLRSLTNYELGKWPSLGTCTFEDVELKQGLISHMKILKKVKFGGEANIRKPIIDNEQVFAPIIVQEEDLIINNDVILDIIKGQDNTEIPPQTSPIVQTQQPQEVPLRISTRERRNAILDYYIDDIALTEEDIINSSQIMQSSKSQK
ncbi:hypothetical protein CR513_59018, partial [Mucuna pruriens]